MRPAGAGFLGRQQGAVSSRRIELRAPRAHAIPLRRSFRQITRGPSTDLVVLVGGASVAGTIDAFEDWAAELPHSCWRVWECGPQLRSASSTRWLAGDPRRPGAQVRASRWTPVVVSVCQTRRALPALAGPRRTRLVPCGRRCLLAARTRPRGGDGSSGGAHNAANAREDQGQISRIGWHEPGCSASAAKVRLSMGGRCRGEPSSRLEGSAGPFGFAGGRPEACPVLRTAPRGSARGVRFLATRLQVSSETARLLRGRSARRHDGGGQLVPQVV